MNGRPWAARPAAQGQMVEPQQQGESKPGSFSILSWKVPGRLGHQLVRDGGVRATGWQQL